MKNFRLALVALLLVLTTDVLAQEYNKRRHLPPEQQAKIANIRAKARVLGSDTFSQGGRQVTIQRDPVFNTGCQGVAIGVASGAAAKRIREQITVVTGDVINAPGKNCRTR